MLLEAFDLKFICCCSCKMAKNIKLTFLCVKLAHTYLNMDYSKNLVMGQKIAHFQNNQIKVLNIFFWNSFKLVFKTPFRCFENNFQ